MPEQDFIDLSSKKLTMKDKLRMELTRLETKYTKLHLPFCYASAKADYERKIEDMMRDYYEFSSTGQPQELKLPKIDEDFYSNLKNFKLISEQEAIEQVRVGTTTESKLIGYHMNYLFTGNKRGYQVSVFIPLKEYQARFPSKNGKEESTNDKDKE